MDKQKDNHFKNLTKTEKCMLGLLTLVAVGILITYVPWGGSAQPTFLNETVATEAQTTHLTPMTYEQQLETKLATILESLEGAGKTSVMVTTSATDEKVLAEEVVECIEGTTQQDATGNIKTDNREDTTTQIVMQKGDTPFIIKENRATIEGVLVLAEGAGNGQVKAEITQAVASVLDVPVHKIAVLKMAQK